MTVLTGDISEGEMTKSKKVMLIVMAVLAAFLAVMWILVSVVYVPEEVPLQYYPGNLSEDLFTAQNNVYRENEALPESYSFKTVPYLIDVPEGKDAEIDTGAIFQAGDFLIYVSEYPDGTSPQNIIANQFPASVLISYVPEYTQVIAMQERKGYINGFSAQYLADRIRVSNGAQSADSVLFAYVLDLDGDYAGTNLIVGVGATIMTQEAFDAVANVLDMVISTVRLDEDRDREIKEEKETARRKREEAAERAAEEAAERERSLQQESQENPSQPGGVEPGPDNAVAQMDIPVPYNYNRLVVDVSWPKQNDYAILELFLPDGGSFLSVAEQTGTTARFTLDNAQAGTYSLHVKSYTQCVNNSTSEFSVSISGDRAGDLND